MLLLYSKKPNEIIGRLGSPLAIGIGRENILSLLMLLHS
jgi:hypothetical protein